MCGLVGHELVGTDAEQLRAEDGVVAREHGGARWHRCLRCDTWSIVPAPAAPSRRHPPERAEITLPTRGRPLRDKIVVRAIAVDRAFHCVVLAALGFGLLAFVEHRDELRGPVYRMLADLHGGAIAGGEHGRTGLLGDIDRAFSLQSSQVELFAVVILVYAVVEGVEAVGLWRERRWAEYLTLLVTASLLPLEIYELAHRVSPFKIVAFAINVAVVIYLLLAKRLFGLRGGAEALRRRNAADTGWAALEDAQPRRAVSRLPDSRP